MSMVFRTIASYSRTLSQALVPAAILILGLVIYKVMALRILYGMSHSIDEIASANG
jgi:hypothetical protein